MVTVYLNGVSDGIDRAGTRAQADIKADFTGGAVTKLRSAYPSKSVIVYANTDSSACIGKPYIHVHYELPLSDWFASSAGFDILVLDNGWFTLAGDGGFQNWRYDGPDGKVQTQGGHVIFGSSATCS